MKSEEDYVELLKDSIKNYSNFYEIENKINEVCKRLSIDIQNNMDTLIKEDKPVLNSNHSSKDVEVYLEELKKYEEYLENKRECENTLIRIESSRNLVLMNKAEKCSGLNNVPTKYRTKVKELAWERGHSCGYSEYYRQLCSLVYIFEDDK